MKSKLTLLLPLLFTIMVGKGQTKTDSKLNYRFNPNSSYIYSEPQYKDTLTCLVRVLDTKTIPIGG